MIFSSQPSLVSKLPEFWETLHGQTLLTVGLEKDVVATNVTEDR